MGDCVDECVVLFVPPDFADEKDRVQYDTGDDQAEEQDAQHQQDPRAPVQHDPGDIERYGERNDSRAHRSKKEFASLSSALYHQPQCKGVGGIQSGSFRFGW